MIARVMFKGVNFCTYVVIANSPFWYYMYVNNKNKMYDNVRDVRDVQEQ